MVNPKEELLGLIAKGNLRAGEKAGFYYKDSGNLIQAPTYNDHIIPYIVDYWSIDNAMKEASSLRRAVEAIAKSFNSQLP